MTYQEFLRDTFIEHHNGMGYGKDEIEEILQDEYVTNERIEKWLLKWGYDLKNEYANVSK